MRHRYESSTLLFCLGVVSLSVAATFVARAAFGHTFYIIILLGVVVASLRGGVLYGVLSTALGATEYLLVGLLLYGKQATWADADLAAVVLFISLEVAWLAGERQDALMRLSRTVEELQSTAEEVKTLRGLIPICAGCKKIRDEEGLWVGIERYLETHTDAQMTHGMCRDCVKRLYPDVYSQIFPESSSNPAAGGR